MNNAAHSVQKPHLGPPDGQMVPNLTTLACVGYLAHPGEFSR